MRRTTGGLLEGRKRSPVTSDVPAWNELVTKVFDGRDRSILTPASKSPANISKPSKAPAGTPEKEVWDLEEAGVMSALRRLER